MTEQRGVAGTACPHEEVDFLGDDAGRNLYFRCKHCAALLVHDGAKGWMIPGGESPAHG